MNRLRRCFRRVLLGSVSAFCGAALGASPALAAKFTVLHSFTGGHDGGAPEAALIADKTGALYGTTYGGGANGAGGTVFELTP